MKKDEILILIVSAIALVTVLVTLWVNRNGLAEPHKAFHAPSVAEHKECENTEYDYEKDISSERFMINDEININKTIPGTNQQKNKEK